MKKLCFIFLTVICFILNSNNIAYGQVKPLIFSFPVNIKWGHSGLDKEQKYKLELEGLQDNTPMPSGSIKNRYKKSIQYHKKGNQKIIPDIQYEKQGDYKYKLTLSRGKNKIIKSYYIHIQVLNRENKEMYLVTSIRKDRTIGSKTTNIQFVDPGADEPFHDKEYNSNEHRNSSEQTEQEINERKQKKSDKNRKNKKGRITESTKTGDERKIEMYLILSIFSLVVILVMGSRKISHKR